MFRGGGVQEHVLALQAEYEKRGHYAKILTPLPRDYEGAIPDNIITVGASMNTKAFVGTAWQWSVSVDPTAIEEILEHEKFDILHFHEPWVPVWGRQLLLRSTSANVATMHASIVDTVTVKTITTVFTPYSRPLIKHFDAFTAVSQPATEYFRTLSHKPVTIVPNGIDVAKYSKRPPTAAPMKRRTILYIGRLEKRKGLKYLLQAYSHLRQNDQAVELIIAGTGPDETSLKYYVEDKEIPGVKFLGYISDEEKIRLLHSVDLFCAPAHFGESFGIVLLEAMAAGCPVVAGDNAGYQTVLTGKGLLSLVNPMDTIEFSRRMELMLNDEDIRKLWIKWAKDHVKQFDYPFIADQYEEVYKQAISRHEKRKSASKRRLRIR